MGKEIWGRQLTTRGAEIGVPKGFIFAAQNEPKSGVPPTVYLHASLEIRFPIPYAIHWECDGDSHVPGSHGSPWPSAW